MTTRKPRRDTLVVVLGGGQGERLYPLTRDRAKPAVPFGGIYRIIDFTLSNCLNSDLRRICILTQYRSMSLERHLRVSWGFLREDLGESLYTVPPQQRAGQRWYSGTADAIYQNIYTLQIERPQRVLILGGDHIYKMDYGSMIDFHAARKAEITVACVPVPIEEGKRFGVMQVDEHNRVTGFEEKPAHPKPMPNDPSRCLASMGIYVFNTRTLVHAVSEDAKANTDHDFGKNIIPSNISKLPVYAFPFAAADGRKDYWRDIGTLDAYWQSSMDLLGATPAFDLSDAAWPIRAEHGQRPPARVLAGAAVEDSILSAGVVVDRARVIRSIIGPGVTIGPDACVQDSVIFDDVHIGASVRINRAIIDKRNVIPAGISIGHEPERDAKRFDVTPGHVCVVPKDMPRDDAFWKGESR